MNCLNADVEVARSAEAAAASASNATSALKSKAESAGGFELRGVFTLLPSLRSSEIDELYSCPWCCRAVLEAMSPLAKHVVMNVLFLGDVGAPLERMADWVEEKGTMRATVTSMQELRVCSVEKNEFSELVKLHPSFRQQILHSLRGAEESSIPWQSNEKDLPKDDHAPTNDFLRRFDNVCWISLLHYLTESDVRGIRQPTESVRNILVRMGLKSEDDRTTTKGYEFVLFDRHHQMWNILKRYIECSQERKVDILRTILRMSFCSLGTQCVVGETSPSLLQDLGNFGLLYYKQAGRSFYFYPTSVGTNVAFGVDQSRQRSDHEERMRTSRIAAGVSARRNKQKMQKNGKTNGSSIHDDAEWGGSNRQGEAGNNSNSTLSSQMMIIVETNFRVYCYTEPAGEKLASEDMALVHNEMLKLFVDIHVLLPNLIVGNITRQSITRAVQRGIETHRIVEFLKVHAHPQCFKRSKSEFFDDDIVPENVVDQIFIWGQELKRVESALVGLLYDFDDEKHYAYVLKYAHDLDAVVWHNDEDLRMVVPKNDIDRMRRRSQEYYTSTAYQAS